MYNSNINSRIERIVKTPIKMASNINPNINNNFEKLVNTPIKEMGSRINNNVLYNNAPDYESTSSSSSIFKKVLFWLAIVLVLAFFGFNIFAYLAYGTDTLATLAYPFTYTFALISGDTAKTTLKHTSEGSQAIVSESSAFLQIVLKFITDLFNNTVSLVANSTTAGIDYLQSNMQKDKIANVKPEKQITEPKPKSEPKAEIETEAEDEDEDEDDVSMLKEDRMVENRVQNVDNSVKKFIVQKEKSEPQPVHSDSQQQGYCYIGKINNSRYCAKVSSRNSCMSGDIFPTMAVCVNPNLRT
jgi:hypothetical protein